MLPNPRYYDLHRDSSYLARRSGLILRRIQGREIGLCHEDLATNLDDSRRLATKQSRFTIDVFLKDFGSVRVALIFISLESLPKRDEALIGIFGRVITA